jgi:hypothetical protein
VPAWCDRILWKTRDKEALVRQASYSHACVLLSDHMPVYAEFAVQVQVVSPERELQVDESYY